jgi:uncharacterized protein YkwD
LAGDIWIGDILDNAGYNYSAAAGFSGSGYPTAQEFQSMLEWNYRAEILSVDYTQAGIAYQTNGHVWVLLLARPSSAPTPTQPPTPRPTETPQPAPTPAPTPNASEFEREVFRLTNIEREKEGLSPLRWNDTLASVARAHSADMANRGYFDHTNPDGLSPFDRMTNAGYLYSSAAENIAAGQYTPQAVVDGWMNSPGHRANILNAGLTELGVGFVNVSGSEYVRYWTQAFGTPR